MTAPARVARVLPDLTGLDKEFDYLIPEDMAPSVQVGSLLRVPLHGRRVGGWVIELDPRDAQATELRPIAKVSSRGPDAALIELARWASVRR